MLALEMASFWLNGFWTSAQFAAAGVVNSQTYKSWTITCADSDTDMAFLHGFVNNQGVALTPDSVQLQPAITVATAAQAYWGVTADLNRIILQKQPSAGSGGGTPGTTIVAKVVAQRPHSLIGRPAGT